MPKTKRRKLSQVTIGASLEKTHIEAQKKRQTEDESEFDEDSESSSVVEGFKHIKERPRKSSTLYAEAQKLAEPLSSSDDDDDVDSPKQSSRSRSVPRGRPPSNPRSSPRWRTQSSSPTRSSP